MTIALDRLSFRTDLRARGVTDHELAAACRPGGPLRRIRPGAYSPLLDLAVRERHAERVRAAVASLSPEAVVSDVSAATLHGLPLWDVDLSRVHVTRNRLSGGRHGRFVHVHAAPLRPAETIVMDGVRVTSLARTVLDVARRLPHEHALVVADGALRTGRLTPRGSAAGTGRGPPTTRCGRGPAGRRVRRRCERERRGIAEPGVDGADRSAGTAAAARDPGLPGGLPPGPSREPWASSTG